MAPQSSIDAAVSNLLGQPGDDEKQPRRQHRRQEHQSVWLGVSPSVLAIEMQDVRLLNNGKPISNGHYGMVLMSQFPIQVDNIRTFQQFLWKDMPNNLLSTIKDESGQPYYSHQAQQVPVSFVFS